MSNRQLLKVLSCWVFLLVTGQDSRQEVYCTSWQLSCWSRQGEIKTFQTNQKTAECHMQKSINCMRTRTTTWRKRSQDHYEGRTRVPIMIMKRKFKFPVGGIYPTRWKEILLFYIALAGPQHPVLFGKLHYLGANEKSRKESSQTPREPKNMSYRNTLQEIQSIGLLNRSPRSGTCITSGQKRLRKGSVKRSPSLQKLSLPDKTQRTSSPEPVYRVCMHWSSPSL